MQTDLSGGGEKRSLFFYYWSKFPIDITILKLYYNGAKSEGGKENVRNR